MFTNAFLVRCCTWKFYINTITPVVQRQTAVTAKQLLLFAFALQDTCHWRLTLVMEDSVEHGLRLHNLTCISVWQSVFWLDNLVEVPVPQLAEQGDHSVCSDIQGSGLEGMGVVSCCSRDVTVDHSVEDGTDTKVVEGDSDVIVVVEEYTESSAGSVGPLADESSAI